MPSKSAPKTATPPPEATPSQRLPTLDDISSQLLAGPVEAPDPPPPPVFEPATEEEDEEDEESPAEEAPKAPSRPAVSSRRGFLGGIAAMAGGAAAATAIPTVAQAAPPVAAPPPVPQPDLGAMMQSFMEIMAEREEKLMARVEARLSAIRPPEQQTANVSAAELAAPPMAYTNGLAQSAAETTARIEQQAIAARPSPRMVAFIPREDPHNPRQTTFKTWINGKEIRAKRGQVMILRLGHGIDLARNGHGNCVDIGAMQGLGVAAPLSIPQHPSFARPADWDGLPLSAQSSVPVMNGIS